MRSLGLFNMTYGTTGLVSSLSLDRVDGSAISMWIMVSGAIAYLGLVPGRKALAALVRRARV